MQCTENESDINMTLPFPFWSGEERNQVLSMLAVSKIGLNLFLKNIEYFAGNSDTVW
jgi:hypothetical protein